MQKLLNASEENILSSVFFVAAHGHEQDSWPPNKNADKVLDYSSVSPFCTFFQRSVLNNYNLAAYLSTLLNPHIPTP